MSPSFCRHNRFVDNCPICAPKGPEATSKARAPRAPAARSRGTTSSGPARSASRAVRVRRLSQAADDGYRSPLVAGLKASADAQRLADELAFAAARLTELERDPPGIYAEIGAEPDAEEALWLAFLTAYLSPAEGDAPFAAIAAAQRPWAGGELPRLDVGLGPRTSHERAAGERTVLAYRAWAARAGGQQAAFAGEPAWTPQRRFERLYERLALRGFSRGGRYELLVSLGGLGLVDVSAATLAFADDAATTAAKRVFGIGDKLLLERRARDLADAVAVPLQTLDLALFNWAAPPRGRATMGSRATVDDAERAAIAAVLGA